jgi:hypothetical protein
MTGNHAKDGFPAADAPTAVLTAGDVAVRATGRDTVTFPAIRDDAPPRCHCGTSRCPDDPRDIPAPADLRVVLSCGPGVVSKMWRTHVRDGVWEDIRAAGAAALSRDREATRMGQERIHNNLDCGWHDLAAVFRADTATLTDPRLAEAFAQVVRNMAWWADDTRRWVAERAEQSRLQAPGGGRHDARAR